MRIDALRRGFRKLRVFPTRFHVKCWKVTTDFEGGATAAKEAATAVSGTAIDCVGRRAVSGFEDDESMIRSWSLSKLSKLSMFCRLCRLSRFFFFNIYFHRYLATWQPVNLATCQPGNLATSCSALLVFDVWPGRPLSLLAFWRGARLGPPPLPPRSMFHWNLLWRNRWLCRGRNFDGQMLSQNKPLNNYRNNRHLNWMYLIWIHNFEMFIIIYTYIHISYRYNILYIS